MRNYRKTREELRKIRSERASKAANARWEQYHASLTELPVYDLDNRPDDMYRITFDNLMTGETHVLTFHPGPRMNNYRIDVDGKPWKVCGWDGAMDRIRKSCIRNIR
jgi:hypothetical protein